MCMYLSSIGCLCFLLFDFPLQQQEVQEQGLLFPFQLQDHSISLPHFVLLALQSHGQRLVVELDTLQDGVGGVSHWENTWLAELVCHLLEKKNPLLNYQQLMPLRLLPW